MPRKSGHPERYGVGDQICHVSEAGLSLPAVAGGASTNPGARASWSWRYGRSFFAFVTVTNAARNGADYASANPTAAADLTGIRNAAVADTSNLLDTSGSNPDVDATTGTDARGDMYTDVTVTYTFSTIFPWPGLPSSINIERTVRARVNE
jgi:hypothetical protein